MSFYYRSLCIPTKFNISTTSPPHFRSQHASFAKLLSVKSREDPSESFELARALQFVEKETQTEAIVAKESQSDTPKLFSLRAREILASRIPSHSSPNFENFNRFDVRYKSEIVRGSFSTPKNSLPSTPVPLRIGKSETPKSSATTADDFIKVRNEIKQNNLNSLFILHIIIFRESRATKISILMMTSHAQSCQSI